MNQRQRARRAARDEDIYRQDIGHAASRAIASLQDTTSTSARPNSNHHTRFGHRLVGLACSHFKVAGHAACHEKQVGVARRGDDIDAQALYIVDRPQQRLDLPVTTVARTGIELAYMKRTPQQPLNSGAQARCKFVPFEIGLPAAASGQLVTTCSLGYLPPTVTRVKYDQRDQVIRATDSEFKIVRQLKRLLGALFSA